MPLTSPPLFFDISSLKVVGTSQMSTTADGISTDPGLPADDYYFCFAWGDSTRAWRVSAPSPISEKMYLGSNEAIILDIGGDTLSMIHPEYEGIENNLPDAAADRVLIYVARLSWGVDETTGYPLFRLLKRDSIPACNAEGRRIVTFTNERSEAEILVDESPRYSNNPLPTCSQVIMDGERLMLAGQPHYSVGRIKVTQGWHYVKRLVAYTADATGVVTYHETDPGTGYTFDQANTPMWGPWLEGRQIRVGSDAETYTVLKALPRTIMARVTYIGEGAADPSFMIDIDSTTGKSLNISFYTDAANETKDNGIGTAGVFSLEEYPTLTLLAAAVNTSTSWHIEILGDSGDADTSLFQEVDFDSWEGRCVSLATKRYHVGEWGAWIKKQVDLTQPPDYDRLAITRTTAGEGYKEATQTESRYVVMGEPNRLWYSSKTTMGAIPEFIGQYNYKDLEMPGDEIVGAGHIGDYVCVLGRRSEIMMQQDPMVIDDNPSSGEVFASARMIYGSPGCVSPRTFIQLANRTALWLSPEGKLVLAGVNGSEAHPISERMRGWMSSILKIDQNSLRYAHAVYDPVHNWVIIHFPLVAPEDARTGDFGVWADAPAVDPHVDWNE